MKLQVKYEAPEGIQKSMPLLNSIINAAAQYAEACALLNVHPRNDWWDVACNAIRSHPHFPSAYCCIVGSHRVEIVGEEAAGAPTYARIFEVAEEREAKTVLDVLWKVQADPEHAGKHPLHDSRYITTADFDFGNPDMQDGSIVCALRDLHNQAEVAKHIVDVHNAWALRNGMLRNDSAANKPLTIYDEVSRGLCELGWDACVESTPERVIVQVDGSFTLECDTANEYWGCDLLDSHGDCRWSFVLEIASTNTNHEHIANDIGALMTTLTRGGSGQRK